MGRTVGHAIAQRLGKCHGLVARVHVDNGLLSRRHDRHQAIFTARKVTVVLELQVLANGLVDHRPGNRQYTSKLRHDRGRRGSRCRHDNGVAQGFENIGHVEVCTPVAAFGETGMVRLIDNDKADTSRTRKAVAMDGKELRRRKNDAGAARSQAGKHVIARRFHGLAGQHANANAERGHRRGKVIGLVGNECA